MYGGGVLLPSSSLAGSQDKWRTEPEDKTEVKKEKGPNYSKSPVMPESWEKQQTAKIESEVEQKNEHSKSSATQEWQDQQQTWTVCESETNRKEEKRKDEKCTTKNNYCWMNYSSGLFEHPFCNQVCKVKSNLKRHIKRKHGDQENNADVQDSGKCQCLDCVFKCHRTRDFRQHLTKRHNIIFRTESQNFSAFAGRATVSNYVHTMLLN